MPQRVKKTLPFLVFANQSAYVDRQYISEGGKLNSDLSEVSNTLKPNRHKCEVTRNGTLKGAKLSLCGMKCNELTLNTVKILAIHFSYNNKIEKD